MAPRRPLETRRRVLHAAFWEIYRHGFQAASIDRILDGTSVTRGALFHHFPDKHRLGCAVIDEVIQPWIHERWVAPLSLASDPVAGLGATIRAYLDRGPDEIILGGCPLDNLTQEMAALDERFRSRLERVTIDWRSAVSSLWRRGAGTAEDADAAERLAGFVVCSIQGLLAAAKLARSRAAADEAADVLLSLLRAARG